MIRLFLVIMLLLGACLTSWASPAPQPKTQVVVFESPPFVMKSEQGYTGLAIELWEESAKKIGLIYEYHEARTFPEFLNAIAVGKADVGVTELTISGERMEKMDFSQPWFDAGLQIMMHKPPGNGVVQIFEQLYESGFLKSYLFIGIGVLVASVLLTAVDRRFDPDFPREWEKGLAESFYHVVSIVTTSSTNHKQIFGSFGRVISAIWLVVGVGITAFITSSVTSIMTVNSMERRIWRFEKSHIEDLPDLKGRKVGAMAESVASMYVSQANLRGQNFNTLEDMVAALVNNQVDAIVADEPSLTYYMHKHPETPVAPVGKIIKHEKYGFGLKLGSPLRVKLSKEVMESWETGRIQELRKKYFGE